MCRQKMPHHEWCGCKPKSLPGPCPHHIRLSPEDLQVVRDAGVEIVKNPRCPDAVHTTAGFYEWNGLCSDCCTSKNGIQLRLVQLQRVSAKAAAAEKRRRSWSESSDSDSDSDSDKAEFTWKVAPESRWSVGQEIADVERRVAFTIWDRVKWMMRINHPSLLRSSRLPSVYVDIVYADGKDGEIVDCEKSGVYLFLKKKGALRSLVEAAGIVLRGKYLGNS